MQASLFFGNQWVRQRVVFFYIYQFWFRDYVTAVYSSPIDTFHCLYTLMLTWSLLFFTHIECNHIQLLQTVHRWIVTVDFAQLILSWNWRTLLISDFEPNRTHFHRFMKHSKVRLGKTRTDAKWDVIIHLCADFIIVFFSYDRRI